MRLELSDQSRASRAMTYEEWLDVAAAETLRRPDVEHQQAMQAVQSLQRMTGIRDRAIELTGEALSKASGKAPTMAEARAAEVAMTGHPIKSEAKTKEILRDEAIEEHEALMAALLDAANAQGGSHV